MDTPANNRLEDVFARAAELATEDRAAWLDVECAGQPELRAEVEELLRSHGASGIMLNSANLRGIEIEEQFARLKPEVAGDRIGNYKLMEQIGEGGFGVVWVAEQEMPVRRRVALKIIKVGMDTKEVVARFEQERQALAMMDHPNIAKVFDAGATPFGRPFFVMELVRGIKITEYCDQATLSTEDRLGLFIAVCHAVQHAHQKGIIHRDLKPSNILVTLHDGVPVPKVIDFGVAKATQQQRLTDLTIYTQYQQMIGTPLYMSPEQAEMSGLDIDTRSDIYSLGVLLYELLTGRTPFDPEELMQKGYDEIRRTIREVEPKTPSMFLKTMDDETKANVAHHRRSDPSRLTKQVSGDLDWIVMKALEKDRSRRYETASGLARDLEHHLADEPVSACRPSNYYRLRKLVRRNKGTFAAAAAILTTLTIAATVSTYLFLREKEAHRRAVEAERDQGKLRQQAETARAAEATEKQNAREAKLKAESRAKEAELKALEATIIAVDSSLRTGDSHAARRRLDSVRPEDRRWEWYWLDGQVDTSVVTLPNSGGDGLHYDANRQRLITFNKFEVHDYNPSTWERSGTASPYRDAGVKSIPPGSPDRSRFDGPHEIIGLDPIGRWVAFRPWRQGPLTLLERSPAPRWVNLETPPEGRAPFSDVAIFSPDGTMVTTAYPQGGVGRGSPASRVAPLWDTATGKIRHSLRSRAGKIMVAAFSPDGKILATGSVSERPNAQNSWTDTLCFWDVKTGALLYSCLNDSGSVLALAFSTDGQTLYAGQSFNVAVVDVPGSGVRRGKRADVRLTGERLTGLALSSAGDRLAVGCDRGHIVIFDAKSGDRKQVLFGLQDDVSQLTFLQEDSLVAALAVDSAAANHHLKAWNILHDPRRHTLRSSGAPKLAAWSLEENPILYVYNPNFNAAGGKVGVPGGWGVAEVWDLASRQVRRLPPSASDMGAFAYSAKRKILALGRKDGVVELRRAPDGLVLTELKSHGRGISVVQFSPDGAVLVAGLRDGTMELWDLDTGSSIAQIPGAGVEVSHLAFGDDGRVLVAATSGSYWEGSVIHQAPVTVSAIRVATRAPLWQWRSERLSTVAQDFDSPSPVTIVGLITDPRRAIVQTSAGGLVTLELETGVARQVQAERTLGYRDTPQYFLSSSPDGTRLASIDESTRLIKILRTEDFAEMLSIAAPGGRAEGVAWSPDGSKLAVLGVGERGQDIEILDVLLAQVRARSIRSGSSR